MPYHYSDNDMYLDAECPIRAYCKERGVRIARRDWDCNPPRWMFRYEGEYFCQEAETFYDTDYEILCYIVDDLIASVNEHEAEMAFPL